LNYQYAKVGGISVRYVDSGGSKNAVLLLHGLGGSIDSWANNIKEMSHSMRVIAVDLPGFGMSDKPKRNYTIKYYQEFVVEFLKSLHLSRASIVGSSLGGHVAAEVAIGHPETVEKLVLISPPGALPSSFKGTPALKNYVRVLDAKTVQQVRQALSAVDGKPVDDFYAQLVYQKMSMPGTKEAFISALKGSAQAPRLTGRLNRIRAPALLLWGKEDAMIPVKFAEPFIKIKNCRIILIENCGHRPHAERPELFNKTVVDFLAG
jgi:2-hydroxy-6-oxonona-2,4-dienedioate hydrolase